MANLRVKVRERNDDTMFTRKTVRVGGRSIDTPIKALSIGKTTRNDSIATEARGFNEIYFETTPEKLREAQRNFKTNLKSNIKNALNKTQTGEFNVVFCRYKSTNKFDRKNLEYLADFLYSTSDFVAVPLMPDLLSAIKDDNVGTRSKYFDAYLTNVEAFITAVRQINGKPVMGVIPTLPRVFINKVIDLYMELGIRAFCFNFNGRTVTAENQLTDMVAPLMRKVATEDLEEDVLFYSLNAHRGRGTQQENYIPARDFMSFGFGMDILGDKHTGGNLPPHLYDEIADSDPTFRLFHRNDYIYRNYEYGPELREKIPSDTSLDVERIMNRQGDNYRLATLLNGEQQAKESKELQSAIERDYVFSHIQQKTGVGEDEIDSMKSTREQFENRQNQQTLSDLDDMLG